LQALARVRVVGGAHPLPSPHELLSALRHPDSSLVIDLSPLDYDAKHRYIQMALPLVSELRRAHGFPHRVIIDEAHYVLSADVVSTIDPLQYGYTLVTYRASALPKAFLDSEIVTIVTREESPQEVQFLADTAGRPEAADEWSGALGALEPGEAIILPNVEEAEGGLRRFHPHGRVTSHVRHRSKYVDVPVPSDKAFVFTTDGRPTGRRALSVRSFVEALTTEPAPVLAHLRRGDVSRWLAEVYGDYELARDISHVERQVARGAGTELLDAVSRLIAARYELAA
jgi:hypothetical protein